MLKTYKDQMLTELLFLHHKTNKDYLSMKEKKQLLKDKSSF